MLQAFVHAFDLSIIFAFTKKNLAVRTISTVGHNFGAHASEVDDLTSQ